MVLHLQIIQLIIVESFTLPDKNLFAMKQVVINNCRPTWFTPNEKANSKSN